MYNVTRNIGSDAHNAINLPIHCSVCVLRHNIIAPCSPTLSTRIVADNRRFELHNNIRVCVRTSCVVIIYYRRAHVCNFGPRE